MDSDIKATGLKELQGLIWESGFKTQEMRAHVYPDVVPCLRDWKAKSADLRIYSSGSVAAQRLFFGHTEEGDLLDLLTAHYDTRIGSKKLASSYVEISKDIECETSDVLFFSDSLDELDAARESEMKTVWVKRPGNPPSDGDRSHPSIESFKDVTWVR